MKATIYTTAGVEKQTIDLPESVFGAPWNADLMHEVVTSMMSNARAPIADTKGRGEVRGGGKKPWKQKGTGRARHGSSRSPIWKGGGITHGPLSARNYTKKINKNVRAKALAIALSKKFADGQVIFVDTFGFSEPKAKDARAALLGISKVSAFAPLASRRKKAALIVTGTHDVHALKSFRNFGNVEVLEAKDINPVEILAHKYVVIAEPEAALKALGSRVKGKKK